MKKFIYTVIIVVIVAAVAIAGATIMFVKSDDYVSSNFPDKTIINGIDCSNLSYKEAEAKLSEHWNKRKITISCPLNIRTANFTDFGYEYDITKHLEEAKANNLPLFALSHYTKAPVSIKIPMNIKSYSDEFKQRVIDSPMFFIENPIKCHDAYVDLKDPEFPIVPEVYGNEPDMNMVFDDLTKCIQMGEMHFIFDEKNYISLPEVKQDDPELLDYQKFCKKHLKQEITYSLGEESFTILPWELAELMDDDLSGKADKKAVKTYVHELAKKYDNVNSDRRFTSLAGKEVTVPAGTYGWMIDEEKESKRLASDIDSGENVTREPVFSVSGYGEYSQDMGNTYIDVDISQQMVRYYKNGKLIFSSECVTGNRATGTVTDVGAFYILNKIRDVVLRGDNADGTEYESFVSYWLGVNWAGEGFHDATWRDKFGGSIWTRDGSHGCINMPPKRMPELYQKAEVGIPVAVHY